MISFGGYLWIDYWLDFRNNVLFVLFSTLLQLFFVFGNSRLSIRSSILRLKASLGISSTPSFSACFCELRNARVVSLPCWDAVIRSLFENSHSSSQEYEYKYEHPNYTFGTFLTLKLIRLTQHDLLSILPYFLIITFPQFVLYCLLKIHIFVYFLVIPHPKSRLSAHIIRWF